MPLFVVGFLISRGDFGVIWRYFGWANQTLATIVLWAGAAYLIKQGKLHWIATIPATFMTAVVATYLAYAPIGFHLSLETSTLIGLLVAAGSLILFLVKFRRGAVTEGITTEKQRRLRGTRRSPDSLRASGRPLRPAPSGGASLSS